MTDLPGNNARAIQKGFALAGAAYIRGKISELDECHARARSLLSRSHPFLMPQYHFMKYQVKNLSCEFIHFDHFDRSKKLIIIVIIFSKGIIGITSLSQQLRLRRGRTRACRAKSAMTAAERSVMGDRERAREVGRQPAARPAARTRIAMIVRCCQNGAP